MRLECSGFVHIRRHTLMYVEERSLSNMYVECAATRLWKQPKKTERLKPCETRRFCSGSRLDIVATESAVIAEPYVIVVVVGIIV